MNCVRNISTAHTPKINTYSRVCGKNKKKFLTWGSSPLSKDANFAPHRSLAGYQLPCSHKPFDPYSHPDNPHQPSTPSHVTFFKLLKDNISMLKIFACSAQSRRKNLFSYWSTLGIKIPHFPFHMVSQEGQVIFVRKIYK
jgi:hypothetical protein